MASACAVEAEIADVLTEVLGDNGQANRAADAIVDYFAGNQVYFPKRTQRDRDDRDAEIIRAVEAGTPTPEILRRHKISYTNLRRILTAHNAR